MGMCTFAVCDDSSLEAFDTFYIQSSMNNLTIDFY